MKNILLPEDVEIVREHLYKLSPVDYEIIMADFARGLVDPDKVAKVLMVPTIAVEAVFYHELVEELDSAPCPDDDILYN